MTVDSWVRARYPSKHISDPHLWRFETFFVLLCPCWSRGQDNAGPHPLLPTATHTFQAPAVMRTSSTGCGGERKRVSGPLDLHLMLSPTTRQSDQHRQWSAVGVVCQRTICRDRRVRLREYSCTKFVHIYTHSRRAGYTCRIRQATYLQTQRHRRRKKNKKER